MTSEIDSKDVVRLMLQYMKENNLITAMHALQTETGVCMNTVDNMDTFVRDIKLGRWDTVLAQVSTLQLPQDKLISLYEQVVLELIESRDIELAREVLRTTEPLAIMKHLEMSRYMRLEQLCSRPYFNTSDAYTMGSSKEIRRQELADALACEVTVAPNSRLLALIGQAMKFQQYEKAIAKAESSGDGTLATVAAAVNASSVVTVPVNLFGDDRGKVGGGLSYRKDMEERLVKREMGSITFSVESHPEAVLFSPDGSSTLVTGSVDGFVEVWEIEHCKLRKDLEYQAKDELMMHTFESNGVVVAAAVICGTFSQDGEHLATGSQDGQVKVWKLSTGVCLRKIVHAHTAGITSVSFNKDNSQILTTSFDHLSRIHGLKSGKTLKEFRGHTSFVNCGVITRDNMHVLTGSSDGTCKLWDYQTTECLLTFRPGLGAGSVITDSSVHTLLLVPNTPATQDQIIVCTRHYQAYLITTQGRVIRTFSSGKQTGGSFTCAALSYNGKWLYCAAEDGIVYMFDVRTGELESILEVIASSSNTDRASLADAAATDASGVPIKQNANAQTMLLNRAKPPQEIIGIAHHAQRNVLATITDDGKLTLWKP